MISILMPLYNGAEFLQDSITSILNQSFKDWELLIGINGHNEQECEIISNTIKEFNDDRIKVFPLPLVKGKVKTLNILKEQSKYDYICLIDVDDYWFPEKIAKQLLYYNKYDVIGSDCSYIGNKLGTPGLFLGKLNYKMFSFQNPIVNSAAMMKKDDAWWDEAWEGLDDYNLWIHLMNKKRTFYNVPEILISHRIHDNSYFNNVNEEMKNKLFDEKLQRLDDVDYGQLNAILNDKKWEI